jgi:hypothetical protein
MATISWTGAAAATKEACCATREPRCNPNHRPTLSVSRFAISFANQVGVASWRSLGHERGLRHMLGNSPIFVFIKMRKIFAKARMDCYCQLGKAVRQFSLFAIN